MRSTVLLALIFLEACWVTFSLTEEKGSKRDRELQYFGQTFGKTSAPSHDATQDDEYYDDEYGDDEVDEDGDGYYDDDDQPTASPWPTTAPWPTPTAQGGASQPGLAPDTPVVPGTVTTQAPGTAPGIPPPGTTAAPSWPGQTSVPVPVNPEGGLPTAVPVPAQYPGQTSVPVPAQYPGQTRAPAPAPLPYGQTSAPVAAPLPYGQTSAPVAAPLPYGQTSAPIESPGGLQSFVPIPAPPGLGTSAPVAPNEAGYYDDDDNTGDDYVGDDGNYGDDSVPAEQPSPSYPNYNPYPGYSRTPEPTARYVPPNDDVLETEDDDKIAEEWEDKSNLEKAEAEWDEISHDKNVKIVSIVFGVTGFLILIFAAHQLIENPDGCFGKICRCTLACVRIICWPCRAICCRSARARERRTHQLVNSDPGTYGYSHDLELT